MNDIWNQLFQRIDEKDKELEKRYYQNRVNIRLRLPERLYAFGSEHGYGEAFDVMKAACERSGLRFNHFQGRGPETGRGYGDLHVYVAEKSEDSSLVAELKLHARDYFTQYSGIKIYSPRLSDDELKMISSLRRFPDSLFIEPTVVSIASIDDKALRLFVANFYEELNKRKM